MESTSPETRPKKRKLRYPRASNACNFCRRRKVRCSGTHPCEVCVREETACEYAAGVEPRTESDPRSLPRGERFTNHTNSNTSLNLTERSLGEVNDSSRAASSYNEAGVASRRSSIDPPQTFVHGTHIGATSGVSFLYGQWGKPAHSESKDAVDANISQAPLMSWGDLPQSDLVSQSTLPQPRFTPAQITTILERYFQYISPTYRFLVQPSVKEWAITLVDQSLGSKVTPAQKACVLLVCAQTLLHSSITSEQTVVGNGDPKMSMACFEMAKMILDSEPGPPSLASVQARIVTVATALGIHRKQSSSSRATTLESEARKRAFWSAYVLDGYLSVMLGRPRLLRDEDIDQPLPNNIADDDLVSSEPVDDLPRHGNLEAFISHVQLAKLMAHGNDQLYPLRPLTNDQLLQRSNGMIDALTEWQNSLPKFLQARQKTFTGQRTFERQNTILKLGWAHARILATRRCLLMDFGHSEAIPPSRSQDDRAKRSIQECIAAIIMVLETVEVLIENGQCYGSFWSTQYIALVAISTLYVLVIQGVRRALPGDVESFLHVDKCFEKARRCHDHLTTLPPPGSQAERHHKLLSHLRSKADRSLAKRNIPRTEPDTVLRRSSKPVEHGSDRQNAVHVTQLNGNDSLGAHEPIDRATFLHCLPTGLEQNLSINTPDGANDLSMFDSLLTPNSSADGNFQYMLDFGWESLDTIGASVRGPEGIYRFQNT